MRALTTAVSLFAAAAHAADTRIEAGIKLFTEGRFEVARDGLVVTAGVAGAVSVVLFVVHGRY